jgi:hypothetical protein
MILILKQSFSNIVIHQMQGEPYKKIPWRPQIHPLSREHTRAL